MLPRRRPLWQVVAGLLSAGWLLASSPVRSAPPSGPMAPASPPSAHRAVAAEALGVSPCELMRGLPGAGHPLRARGVFAEAFRTLDAAGRAPERQAAVLRAFLRARGALLTEAARAFSTGTDGETGFLPSRAERFLSSRVLVPNGPLRIGRDGFEVAPEALSGLALAACRARDVPQVLAAARGATGPDGEALRVSALVVSLFSASGPEGEPDALSDLTHGLAPRDFMSTFALTELALRRGAGGEARALHARARAFVATDDEDEAWRRQEQRL
jgi:hypothetical protein